MATINHNFGGTNTLIAVPISGTVNVTLSDSANQSVGKTTTNANGTWKQSFSVPIGTYSVKFDGHFRPVGSISGTFLSLTSSVTKTIVVSPPKVVLPTGPQGEKGNKGDKGDQGDIGSQGTQGTQGSQGDQGGQGNKGDKGDTGTVGPEGPSDISKDTTPLLGGDLDASNKDIDNVATLSFNSEIDLGTKTTDFTVDWNNGQKQKVVLNADITTISLTDPPGPCNLTLKVIQDDTTGGRTVTNWDDTDTVKWPAETAPTLSTGINDVDIVTFYFDGTNYYAVASLNFG